ncbi:MAG TPA: hypothetical protein VFI96_01695 [Longimicrobiaceae bacterium]|nr:hypothetical protein [Longimicrobiaceae bacterium]
MTKRIAWPALLLLLPGCAHLPAAVRGPSPQEALWDQAQEAFYANDFSRADSLFTRLSTLYPDTDAGREAIFYLGTLRLDPRNPAWDPKPAEAQLQRYLAQDTADPGTIHRRPEAMTLYQLAHQLNMPPAERVPGLQPPEQPEKVVTRRVVVPAKESQALADKVAELRNELDSKNAAIQKLQDELERIRKTLTGKKD